MVAWIDLTPDLTAKGKKKLNVGQVLIFDFEGSKTYLKIMRKRHGKVWAKEITTYSLNEVAVVDGWSAQT